MSTRPSPSSDLALMQMFLEHLDRRLAPIHERLQRLEVAVDSLRDSQDNRIRAIEGKCGEACGKIAKLEKAADDSDRRLQGHSDLLVDNTEAIEKAKQLIEQKEKDKEKATDKIERAATLALDKRVKTPIWWAIAATAVVASFGTKLGERVWDRILGDTAPQHQTQQTTKP